MKKKSKLLVAIFIVLFLIIVSVVGSLIYIKSSLKPTKAFVQGEVCSQGNTYCEITPFVVDEGSYGKSTIDKLEASGIIKDATTAYYWNRVFGGYSFYAGYFEIPHKVEGPNGVHDITLDEVLAFLSDPKNAHQDTVLIKLAEGDFASGFAYTISEYVSLKEMATDDVDAKAQTLIDYWNDEDNVRTYMEEYPFLTDEIFNSNIKVLLEGYLFPDTYEFFEYSSCDEITRKLLDRTLEIYDSCIDLFESSKLSIHEVFTLASMCQWESGSYVDSKGIAGVFLNRINNPSFEGTGGRLQSTVTACYAFGLTNDECYNLGDTTEYTEREHPYNTYTIEGFPPGPVCNPNEKSIRAALEPDNNNYYFFSADMCNGGTVFATTYAQHEVNVAKYFVPCS